MKKYLTYLNIIYVFSVSSVILIALAALPRWWAFLIAALYLIYVILASLKNAVLLFIRSIPFFIALPISVSFDNFNTWRIVLLAIFIKWLFINRKNILKKIKQTSLSEFWHFSKIEFMGLILFVLAVLSLLTAYDLNTSIKRIIYFVNLAMIYLVIKSLVKKDSKNLKLILKNIIIVLTLIIAIGFLQQAAAFLLPADIFQQWWAGQISQGFYGQKWSDIAMNGNTWYCYTAGSLKLRMFSVFPDSHSFPLFILICLPALLALLAQKLNFKKYNSNSFIKYFVAKAKHDFRLYDLLLLLILANFALMLTGTRGIWLAVFFPLCGLLLFGRSMKKISSFISMSVLIFAALFLIAPFFYSLPQFQTEKISADQMVFFDRMKNAFSLSETSNAGRVLIWQKTLQSIKQHPILGVGIGNFPVVLKQSVEMADAGSSAHNLYLNVAAEMGLAALIVFLWFCFELLRASWSIFKKSDFFYLKTFGLACFVYLIWVFGYSLTDAALFDERAFLIFMVLTAIISGLSEKTIKP